MTRQAQEILLLSAAPRAYVLQGTPCSVTGDCTFHFYDCDRLVVDKIDIGFLEFRVLRDEGSRLEVTYSGDYRVCWKQEKR